MNYTQIKQLKSFCESLHSQPDWKQVLKESHMGTDDFEVDNVRFIRADAIQEILEDELSADEYLLGCFTASAIAEATGWPNFLIEAAQKGDQYEEIGKAMTGEHVAELARIYAYQDGYGHHFNGYDFSEEELTINGFDYHVFDNQ